MKSGQRALEKKELELFSIRCVCALICRLLEKYLSCSTERIFAQCVEYFFLTYFASGQRRRGSTNMQVMANCQRHLKPLLDEIAMI